MNKINKVQMDLRQKREWLSKLQHQMRSNSVASNLLHGVSVIVPCFQGAATIGTTLQSLYEQTLSFELYEVIIVLNGDDDGSFDIATEFGEERPEFNLRIFFNSQPGAGAARNVGLTLVRHEHVSFVDADDYVERAFLQKAIESKPIEDCIIASPILNLDENGNLDAENSLNLRIRDHQGSVVSVSEVPWLLGFNACKMVPTRILAGNSYREDLDSGEDLVFFANLLGVENLKVVFLDSDEDAAYIRRLSENSVSRQAKSFEFNVKQRAECLFALRDISVSGAASKARIMLERAQVSFIQRYLEEYPEDADKLDKLLIEKGFVNFPWNWINDGKANDLAFSYCFVPFSDTSGVIAAKAIAERGKVVDVISADMSKIRGRDESLRFLCSRWLDKTIEISVPPSFADWKRNVEFAQKAMERARERQLMLGRNYATLYSRALWIGSHIAGAYFKIEYPETVWTAEFSDPLRFDVEGNPRVGELPDDAESRQFIELIASQSPVDLEIRTIFDLVEAVTMLLADELIFTNSNQLEYMLSKYPRLFSEKVRAKAIVREHPSPRKADYEVGKVDANFSSSRINIAYFGAFYVNRGLGDVFTALQNLRADEQQKISLHIYCSDPAEAAGQIVDLGLSGMVTANPYLPYLQFLNAATQADVLLVNDVQRSSAMDINPFLPSKYSDYKASGSKIWGILDDGSPLSQKSIDFVSSSGDVPSSIRAFREIISHFAA